MTLGMGEIGEDYNIYGKKMEIKDYWANGSSHGSDIFEFYAMAVYRMDDVLMRWSDKILDNGKSDFKDGAWDKDAEVSERFLRKNF